MARDYRPSTRRYTRRRHACADPADRHHALTALVGAALARADGGGWHLVLIEDFGDAEAWARLLRGWRDTPFAAVECLPGRASEARALAALGRRGLALRFLRERIKREQRRAVFARLEAIDATLRPARVAVGNDRRPETQFALALAARRGDPRPGVYLDDGLFSYVGDVHSRPLARALFDTPLKRLAWGGWWQAVDLAGTSRWIARAHLALPAAALDRDPSRLRLALPREAFAGRAQARLALAAWRAFAGGPVPRLDAIGARGARLLPAAIAFELLLPLLRPGAVVAGSASTALLAARWLRPDLAVVDLGGGGDFGRRAGAFLATHGVRPASALDAVVDGLTHDRRYLRDS